MYVVGRGAAAAGRRDLTFSRVLDLWWWDHCGVLAGLTPEEAAEYLLGVNPSREGLVDGRPGVGFFYGWTAADRELMLSLRPNVGHYDWHYRRGGSAEACGRSLYERAAREWLRRHPDRVQSDYVPRVWFDLGKVCSYQPRQPRQDRRGGMR